MGFMNSCQGVPIENKRFWVFFVVVIGGCLGYI